MERERVRNIDVREIQHLVASTCAPTRDGIQTGN